MRMRTFGRLGWQVGELGYGMWGMGGWTGSEDKESMAALGLAASRGINFFDTAQAYGDGHSEQLLGMLLASHRGKRIFAATKVPPKNRQWPSRRGTSLLQAFPRAYVREYVDISRSNLGVDTIDLLQLHVWEDDWLDSGELAQTVAELKREGSIRAFGISLNRWEPWNGIRAVRSGLVDAVQVIYNIFDQAPEDELFPACREMASRSSPGCRSTRAVSSATLRRSRPGRRRLARDVLRQGEPRGLRRPCGRSQAARARRYDPAGHGLAIHPVQPGRGHRNPRHAQSRPRRIQRGRQRSGPALAGIDLAVTRPPLGPSANELEPVGDSPRAGGPGRCPVALQAGPSPGRPARAPDRAEGQPTAAVAVASRRRTAGRMPPSR